MRCYGLILNRPSDIIISISLKSIFFKWYVHSCIFGCGGCHLQSLLNTACILCTGICRIIENIVVNYNGKVVVRTNDGQLLSLDEGNKDQQQPSPRRPLDEGKKDQKPPSPWRPLDREIRHPQDAFALDEHSETYGAVVVDIPGKLSWMVTWDDDY